MRMFFILLLSLLTEPFANAQGQGRLKGSSNDSALWFVKNGSDVSQGGGKKGAVPPTKKGTQLPAEGVCNACPTHDFSDWTTRVGLGESPGVPGLEYLGLGYNFIFANPRGSPSSEIDPGFRHRVMKLEQSQDSLTIDTSYLQPLGTDVKYSSSCKFSSSSIEVTTETQYQEELMKESSISSSTSLGLDNIGKSFTFGLGVDFAFSQSSKYEEFKDRRTQEQTVTYEARALCTEFEARFKPSSSPPILEEHFEAALESLPTQFDASSPVNVEQYSKFLRNYGTHYIDYLVLGAKHIYSTILKASDVMELTRTGVDIKTTLSLSVQASLSKNPGTADDQGAEDQGGGVGNVFLQHVTPAPFSNVFYITNQPNGNSSSDGTNQLSGPSGTISSTNTWGDSFSSQISSLKSIKEKVIEVTEVNIGGLPPVDGNWKTWAASVKERPMPVYYTRIGLWELMDVSRREPFFQAVEHLYGVNLTAVQVEDKYLEGFRFGVSDPTGTLISTYSLSPQFEYRALVRLNEVNKTGPTEQSLKINEGTRGSWKEISRFDKPGYFACGVEIQYDDSGGGTDDYAGVTGIRLWFCSLKDWREDPNPLPIQSDPDDREWRFKTMCDQNYFIVGAQVRHEAGTSDPGGMTDLIILCQALRQDGNVVERGPLEGNGYGEFQEQKIRRLGDMLVTGAYARVGSYDGGEETGIEALGLVFDLIKQDTAPGPPSNLFTYNVVYERSRSAVSPIFATMIRNNVSPNKKEDLDELGFLNLVSGRLVFQAESFNLFGLSTDSSESVIAVTNFKEDLLVSDLHSFMFMTTDSLPTDQKVITGVVHAQGYPLNGYFGNDIGFDISQDSDREFIITFSKDMDIAPTFVTFPYWSTNVGNVYPKNVGQVAVTPRKCTRRQCSLVVGSKESEEESKSEKYLGFSFIAVDGNFTESQSIVHGVVELEGSAPWGISNLGSSLGFTASAVFKRVGNIVYAMTDGNADKIVTVTDQWVGGVLITFEKPFLDIPSVSVSAHVGSENEPIQRHAEDEVKLPSVIVEHVNRRQLFVKAGIINTLGVGTTLREIYKPLTFHFVAVGPTATSS
ncbi:hypothetical protein HJC23_002679 [Cyclotella cryptica]|uniref:MACPF domain-containing protein n=1 Tax=Cyclotella cryptica TaxID=29204 RepID=A0ABD3NTL4_9STRA